MERKKIIGFRRNSLLLALSSWLFALYFLLSALRSLLFILCSLLYAFVMLLLALSSSLIAEAADRLVVKDSGGVTKFFVKDNGDVGIGTTVPVQ
jgi:hypothetical protein